MKRVPVFIFVLSMICSCGQKNNKYDESRELVPNPEGYKKDTFIQLTDTITSNSSPVKKDLYYPFQLNDVGGQYHIMADIESEGLYPKYYNLFKKYGYEGNGSCWEGHIIQILEKTDKTLLSHIQFDPEGGGFYATADTKGNQLRFVKLLSPIFSNLTKLEEWIKQADASRIDD